MADDPRPETKAEMLARLRATRDAVETVNRALSKERAATFAAALEAEQARQRKPESYADELADTLIPAMDARLRERWGSMPWVRHTMRGRVLSVNTGDRTCKVALPLDGTRAMGGADPSQERLVRFGMGVPRVGKTYAVHFPFTLPDAPTALLTGPVPAGLPWLKATGLDTYFYYKARTPGTSVRTVYRVAVPPQANPGDTWTLAADDVAAVYTVAGNVPGVMAGPLYTTEELAYVVPIGWPGAFTFLSQFGATPNPYGTNFTATTETDAVLGRTWVETSTPNPSGGAPGIGALGALYLTRNGQTTTVYSGLQFLRPVLIPNAAYPSGFDPTFYPFFKHNILGAYGFDAVADTPMWQTGDFVALWFLSEIPLEMGAAIPTTASDFTRWVHMDVPTYGRKLVIAVSVNGGPATLIRPSQPPGFTQLARGTAGADSIVALRQMADGEMIGYGVWHAVDGYTAQTVVINGVVGTQYVPTRTADIAYRGRSINGISWTWTQISPPMNSLTAVSPDGSIAILERFDAHPQGGVTLGARFITRDSGASWGPVLPLNLPYVLPDDVGFGLGGRLIDVP